MKKLIIGILSLSLIVGLCADDESSNGLIGQPTQYLDTPVEKTPEPPVAPVIGFEAHVNISNIFRTSWSSGFINHNLGDILEFLLSLDKHSHYNQFSSQGGMSKQQFNSTGAFVDVGFLSGDFLSFQQDIAQYVDDFEPSAEIYNMTMGNGDSSFVGNVGENLTFDTDPFAEDTYNGSQPLVVYAGRNTSIGRIVDGGTVSALTITTADAVYELSVYGINTPIVLDMDGDNKLQASNGQWLPHNLAKDTHMVTFDINGDGFEEYMEWVGPNDGILVQYNGGEMTGLNMFGAPGGFDNGYEKLSGLDINKDKVLNGDELATLSVWQDKNTNARVDAGEVKSLQSLGITSLDLNHRAMSSSFVQNGKSKMAWDWHPVFQIIKKTK